MSSDTYRRQIQNAQAEIAKFQRDKGREARKVADISKKINSATQAAGRTNSTVVIQSKMREIARYREDEARAQRAIADLDGKIAREQKKVHDAQKNLVREEDSEAKQQKRKAEREGREHASRMNQITGKLSEHDRLHQHTLSAIERLKQLPERIVVLFLAANPLDQAQLRLDEEARAIAEMIRKSEHRDAVKLESRWAVRPLDVLQAINENKPHIVHFSGHGSEEDQIVFQDDAGHTKVITKEAIVQTMAAASGDIRLVFFNTCYSRNQAEAVVQHVDAAIGMNTSIGDTAARVFAAQFYSAIGFGLSVKRAFEQAIAALMLEDIHEENTPELFVAGGIDPDQLVLVRPPDAAKEGE